MVGKTIFVNEEGWKGSGGKRRGKEIFSKVFGMVTFISWFLVS